MEETESDYTSEGEQWAWGAYHSFLIRVTVAHFTLRSQEILSTPKDSTDQC